ncbi:hypothetical protein Bca52824_013738 [Brassica carinata]|uniref:Uncharacterized protein n=1 Tax=Brassica carinata TaxID=52824 RepID=A0A8X7W0Z7_BRACI|nr:hypothetical protein Bca52824_013738 [Brassica carinata]
MSFIKKAHKAVERLDDKVWERFDNNPSGKYKYDDVNGGDKNRFIVETTLAREFDIARPTVGYISLLAQLPRVFVGTPEELKQLVRIMSFEIRRSMKRAKTHVPPWRRNVVTKFESCGCGPPVGFKESVKTARFNDSKEVDWKKNCLKVGQLTMAFKRQ